MQLDITVVFSSLIGLFLLLGTGFFAVKRGILPVSGTGVLSPLLMRITLPCTVFTSMLRPYDPAFLAKGAIVVMMGFLLFGGSCAITWWLSRVFRTPQGSRGMWAFAAAFCNNGFMGFPVALALFGEEGLALAALFGIPFNLLIYSVGARMVSVDGNGSQPPVRLLKVLLTPINGAVVLGLAAYVAQLSIPAALLTPIQHFANVTTPLSMFVTGMTLAGSGVSGLLRDRTVLTATFARLLLMPGLSFVLLRLIPFSDPLIPRLLIIIMAMPAPAVATILAESYGGNRALGAKVVFLSSLLCIATIPVFALLL